MPEKRLTKAENAEPWHLVGAGAIGSLLASYLHSQHTPITLIAHRKNESGERCIQRNGDTVLHRFGVSSVDETTPIHRLMVTTKAYDVATSLATLSHRIAADTRVVIIANGMGFTRELGQQGFSAEVFQGTTTLGAYRAPEGNIVHAGMGRTIIGREHTSKPAWFTHWRSTVPDCHWDADIETALWLKLAINCAINPLTAINDCLNGELYNQRHLRAEVTVLCDEIAEVSHRVGHSDMAAGLHDTVTQVIQQTAGNRSSMLQDVSRGQRTEIDYMTGYLLRTADTLGMALPRNSAVYEQVKAIEPDPG